MVSRPVLLPRTLSTGRPSPGATVQVLRGETMGTYWSLQFACGPDQQVPGHLRTDIVQALDRVCQQMSHWDEASELSQYSRVPAGHWHPVSPDFAAVMRCALEVARLSGGGYDPAAAPWVNLWGFGPRQRYDEPGFQPPPPAACEAVRRQHPHGWADVRLAEAPHPRLWQPGGVQLDLGAVAKGYAVDLLSRVLREQGWGHHLVEIGGELRGEGVRPDGQPWWVSMELPSALGADSAPVMALHGLAVATSGDYRRCFERDGRWLSHTIDPRTGQPVTHGVASVTVLHRECMWADAWSTALSVLGVDEGLALADRLALPAFVVHRHGEALNCYASTAFEAMLE